MKVFRHFESAQWLASQTFRAAEMSVQVDKRKRVVVTFAGDDDYDEAIIPLSGKGSSKYLLNSGEAQHM